MDSWWLPLNIFWLTLMTIGLALLLFHKKAFIKGIFGGIIIIGLIGFSTDRYSKANAAAYKARLQTELLNLTKQHIK